jgi:hypothetical protein
LNAFSVDDSQQLNKEEPSKEALNKKELILVAMFVGRMEPNEEAL